MADKKISALTGASTPLAGTEVLPVVQSGATVKVAVSDLTAGRAVSAGTLLVTGASTQVSAEVFRNSATSFMRIAGGSAASLGANIIAFGESHASAPGRLALTAVGTGNAILTSAGRSLTLDSTAGNATLDAGNFVPGVAAKGVNFTANTPAAGMTSQLLNWYEEGTWTPSIGGTATYTVQEGRYVKVGSFVYLQAKIQINVLGTGSTTTITGAPFTSLTTSFASGGTGSVAYFGSLATAVTTLIPSIGSGSTSIIFGSVAVAATTMTASTAVFGNSTRIDFSMTYRAA